MSGHSFEFSPGGIVAVSQESNGTNETIIPANADMFRVQEPRAAAAPKAQPARRIALDKPLNVIKAAKARLRELEREIKRVRALEKERDELRRLLDAATNKPRAVVRELTTARRG